jgi:homoserine trans-succinylase
VQLNEYLAQVIHFPYRHPWDQDKRGLRIVIVNFMLNALPEYQPLSKCASHIGLRVDLELLHVVALLTICFKKKNKAYYPTERPCFSEESKFHPT